MLDAVLAVLMVWASLLADDPVCDSLRGLVCAFWDASRIHVVFRWAVFSERRAPNNSVVHAARTDIVGPQSVY